MRSQGNQSEKQTKIVPDQKTDSPQVKTTAPNKIDICASCPFSQRL